MSIANFLKETKIELKKVNWPTPQQTVRYTGTVILISLLVAAFLGGLDAVFGLILNRFILN